MRDKHTGFDLLIIQPFALETNDTLNVVTEDDIVVGKFYNEVFLEDESKRRCPGPKPPVPATMRGLSRSLPDI